MLHIAVCDHEEEARRQLGGMARRYLACRRELHGRVCLFRSAEELLDTGNRFGICVLNADLPEGGLEAGERLKDRFPETALVLYSRRQEPSVAIQAYRMRAVQYLPAPVEERQLFETLDQAAYECGAGPAPRIVLNSTEGLVNLRISQIAYAKSSGHRITFCLLDGRRLESKCLRISFGSIIEPMLKSGFLRCHDSYAVNLGCALRLTAEGVQLGDGTLVPVSTKKRAAVRDALQYCGG